MFTKHVAPSGAPVGTAIEFRLSAWLPELVKMLLAGIRVQADKKGGVKIVDFSELPSDVLPLIVGRIACLIFTVQQWTPKVDRHPVALFCDEAYLYIPNRNEAGSVADAALHYFERIAKEGRKYGVGLAVISLRPAEVNRTVLSQCNNFVALRLTNAEDQNVVRRLLPDSLGGFTDLLPVLDTGEALVVGDESLLPSRIRISEPKSKPDSGTVNFGDEWLLDQKREEVAKAVAAWRRQSMKQSLRFGDSAARNGWGHYVTLRSLVTRPAAAPHSRRGCGAPAGRGARPESRRLCRRATG